MQMFFDILTDIVGALIVLGILVFVHEWGHFAVAKLCKVRVEVFSLGFGKRLWGFRRGETDYRISALPFGGYVRMAGENPMEEHSGAPWEFMSHPRWQRFLIAIAGPVMNVVLAVLAMTVVLMMPHFRESFRDQPVDIGYVRADSPATRVGLRRGDKILQADGKDVPTWESIEDRLVFDAGAEAELTFESAGQRKQAKVAFNPQPGDTSILEAFGIGPPEPNIVVSVEKESPAELAGIRAGDEIVAVDHTPVPTIWDMIDVLQRAKNHPVAVTLKRGTTTLDLTLTPQLSQLGSEKPRYRVGVSTIKVETQRFSFLAAVQKSVAWAKENSTDILDLLSKLVRHERSIKQMAGPVGIAQVSGQATREGFLPFLYILALISLNLGILNLLPIPILDGGLILMLCIEGLLRRDIKREVKELVYQAAFVLILLFFAVVLYNDVSRTALGHFLHMG